MWKCWPKDEEDEVSLFERSVGEAGKQIIVSQGIRAMMEVWTKFCGAEKRD